MRLLRRWAHAIALLVKKDMTGAAKESAFTALAVLAPAIGHLVGQQSTELVRILTAALAGCGP